MTINTRVTFVLAASIVLIIGILPAAAEECSQGIKLVSQNEPLSVAQQDNLLRRYKSTEIKRLQAIYRRRAEDMDAKYLREAHRNVLSAEMRKVQGKEWEAIEAQREARTAANYEKYQSTSDQIYRQIRAANMKGDHEEVVRLMARSESIYATYSEEYARIEKDYADHGRAMEATTKETYNKRIADEYSRYRGDRDALRAEYDAALAKIRAMTYGDVPTSYVSRNSSADCSLVAGTSGAATASAANGGKPVDSSNQCGGLGSPPLGFSCPEWARYMDAVAQQRQLSAARRRSAFIDAATGVGGEVANLPLGPASSLLSSIQAQAERRRGNFAKAASISFTAGFAEITDTPVFAVGCAATATGGPAIAAVGCVPAGGTAVYVKNKIVGAGSHLFFRMLLSDSDTATDLRNFSIMSYE